MTNNQLTDAQISNATLIRLIRWADDHKSHYVAAALRELQERRNAEKDSEPVAYTDERNLGYIDRGRETAYLWGKQNSETGDVPLYRHAQPAQISEPVLPLQDKDLQGAIDALEHPAGINAAGKQVVRHALVELQERRKVERDTEPYGFTDGDRRGMIYKPEHSDRLSEPVPVYRHAQPAPVVSADLLHTAASAIEDLLTTNDRTGAGVWFDLPFRLRSAANAQPVTVVPDRMTAIVKDEAEYVEGLNACRAAMLAAAPQSPGGDHATVPGKWIPVSERMPENDGAYLCWDNRYVTTYAFIFGAWQANQFVAKNITHWMPLPAAPQGVKGE